MRRRTADIDGLVHYVDYGGDGPPIVLVHGLGGNHANWLSVAGALTSYGRVLAPDLPGFGLTDPLGRSTSVAANRKILGRFIDEVGGGPALLVGNSMGGLLSIMQAAAAPRSVRGLVLANPAIPRPVTAVGDPRIIAIFGLYTVPFAGEAFIARRSRRLGPERMVRETLKVCTVDPSRIPEDVVEALIDIARQRATFDWPHRAYLEAARSIVTMVTRRARFLQMVRSVTAPTLLVHGDRDRLVPLAAAKYLALHARGWQLTILRDAGHIPMLKAPEAFTAAVTSWLDDQPSTILREAT